MATKAKKSEDQLQQEPQGPPPVAPQIDEDMDFLSMLEEGEKDQGVINPCTIELSYNAKKGTFNSYNYMEEGDDAKNRVEKKVLRLLYLTKVLEVFNLKRDSEGKFTKLTSTPFRNYDDYPVTVFINNDKRAGGGSYDDVRDFVKQHDGGVSHLYYCLDLDTNKLIQFRAEGAPKGNSRKAAFLKAARSGIANLPVDMKEVQPTKGFIKNPSFELHATETLVESDLSDFYLLGVKLTTMANVTKEQLKLAGTFYKMVTEYVDSFKTPPAPTAEPKEKLPVDEPETYEEPDFEGDDYEEEDFDGPEI